ncbi:hypothetical protein BGX26_010174 [Mortierella sp. AD094]|nr:hypothetical protein BGX26_010174 [Mortierella sp. AD094]
MTNVYISCLTTDPSSSTFYALAYIQGYGSNTNTLQAAILVSNSNPANIAQISWSVVSTIYNTGLYDMSGPGSLTCIASASGVVTVVSRFAIIPPNLSGSPGGIQYDPAGAVNTKFSQTGPGGWYNITGSSTYTWSYGYSLLFYVGDKSGNPSNSTLVHATSTGSYMYFGSVSTSTKTMDNISSWQMPSTSGVGSMAYSNGVLYAYANKFGPGAVYMFPLTGLPGSSIPSNPSSFNATTECSMSQITYSGVINNEYYYICIDSVAPSGVGLISLLYLNTNAEKGTSLNNGTILSSDLDHTYFTKIGDGSNGVPAFGVTLSNNKYYGITLTGSSAGMISGPVNVTVPFISGTDAGSGGGHGVSVTAIVVGCITFFLIIGCLNNWCRRKPQSRVTMEIPLQFKNVPIKSENSSQAELARDVHFHFNDTSNNFLLNSANGNVIDSGNVMTTGTVTNSGNFSGSGNIYGSGNISGSGNIFGSGNISGSAISNSGNIAGSDAVLNSGNVTSSGNIINSANVATSGNVVGSGNVSSPSIASANSPAAPEPIYSGHPNPYIANNAKVPLNTIARGVQNPQFTQFANNAQIPLNTTARGVQNPQFTQFANNAEIPLNTTARGVQNPQFTQFANNAEIPLNTTARGVQNPQFTQFANNAEIPLNTAVYGVQSPQMMQGYGNPFESTRNIQGPQMAQTLAGPFNMSPTNARPSEIVHVHERPSEMPRIVNNPHGNRDSFKLF